VKCKKNSKERGRRERKGGSGRSGREKTVISNIKKKSGEGKGKSRLKERRKNR